MKRGWLKTAIAVLLIVLIMGSLILFASGSSTVYLLSVNDIVMEMTAENMPVLFEGQLYIPYTMLSSQVTGINLGVRAQYSASRGTLTVTDGQKTILFDLRKNTATDGKNTVVSAMALVRNNMVYIPINWLCKTFDQLIYSLSYTSYGLLVRLSNDAVVLTDEEFVDAAASLLRQNYLSYRDSQAASPSVSPSPSPSPSPTPSTPPPVPEAAAQVYLAFRWSGHASQVADLLEENDQRALFLFTSKELMQQDDLVRRLVARGHQVGLSLTGDTVEDCLSQLSQSRQLMNDICRSPLLIVAAEDLSPEVQQVLKDRGCAIWIGGILVEDMTWTALDKRLETDVPNYVELICNADGLNFLKVVLNHLRGDKYDLRQLLAPVLLP